MTRCYKLQEMLIILVGPKGSGKSHIGRLLEKRLGVLFFHVEPLWMDYYAECRSSGREPEISGGISRICPSIVGVLRENGNVCVETTGASKEILNALLSLEHPSRTLLVRISAPLETCLERIAKRDQTGQIPMNVESIRKVHEACEEILDDPEWEFPIRPALILENRNLAESNILSVFGKLLNGRE